MTGTVKEVRFVNFQKVQELGIFIGGNQEDEETTVLSRLVVMGEAIEHSGLKRTADQQASATKADWLGKGVS